MAIDLRMIIVCLSDLFGTLRTAFAKFVDESFCCFRTRKMFDGFLICSGKEYAVLY